MKKNGLKLKMYVVAAALILNLPMMIFAEGSDNKIFSIGPRASYYSPKDSDNGQWYGGAQARLYLSQSMGLEGSMDYRSNDFDRFTTIKTIPIQASLLAYLMPGAGLNPFLIAGAGWYYTQVNGPFGYSDTYFRFGLHVGAGIEIKINPSLSLDGTYRYIWLESVTSHDVNTVATTYQDSGSMITMALNFLFQL